MTAHLSTPACSSALPGERTAFTLLEVLGVLVVLGVLAGVLLPFLTRSIDRIVSERETASLDSFGAALERSVARLGSITNAANLPAQIAAELGVNVSKVSVNARRQPRVFLADPAMLIDTGALPYTQTDTGSKVLDSTGHVVAPANPRLLIISTLGQPLPSLSGDDFNAIWNNSEPTLPATSAFASWKGRASDLKVKRVHLCGLFIRLLLAANRSQPGSRYSVRASDYDTATPVPSGTLEAFFIRNSVLLLYNSDGRLDSKQVLTRDASFVYDHGVWRSCLDAVPFEPGLDLRGAASQFLSAPANVFADPNSTPSNVVQSVMGYFDAYYAWAGSNFTDAALKSRARAAQADMMTSLQGLYLIPNAPREEACP